MQQMDQIKRQLEDHSPLYPVLVDQVAEFLEPCLDYVVSHCNHKKAFCPCGNTFLFRDLAGGKRVWLEKFCPHCGEPNKHNSLDYYSPVGSWKSVLSHNFQSRPGKHFLCPRCAAFIDFYGYKYCTQCRHKLKWRAQLCILS